MSKYGIIAIGYNRPDSMKRLIEALNIASYDDNDVKLIVSIDNSGTDSVLEVANKLEWRHGTKIVKTFAKRQGLRNHILQCGSYIEEFNLDAVAVFEDDVIPSPAFYSYMKQCVERYCNNDRIAGISLYTHLTNVNASLPFYPQGSKYDIFFMQFAQSWGQVWMKNQWKEFYIWYKEHNDDIFDSNVLPAYVCRWPKSSWLKYHIKYCVENNKYFVYPYQSYSTCFCEAGEHCGVSNTRYHVPMQCDSNVELKLPDSVEGGVVYDCFFERMLGDEICVNIYGTKKNWGNSSKLLTKEKLSYKLIQSYGLQLKPHEMNFLLNIQGNDIFLYQVDEADSDNNITLKEDVVKETNYYYNYFPTTEKSGDLYRKLLILDIKDLCHRIKSKICKLLRK